MKSFKKLKLMAVIGIGLILAYATNVFASGSASLTIEGDSSVAEGSNITLNLYVTDITSDAGGVVSVGGVLNFETAYLEYVSADAATDPYTIQYQAKNVSTGALKIAGIDNTMEAGITSKTRIISVTFKALKQGSTTVTFDNGELADTGDILNATFGTKTITIGEATTPDPGPVDPDPGPTPGPVIDPEPTPATKSNDATLSDLGVSGYSLSPAFDSSKTSYTLTVPKDATSITVTGTTNDTNATVSGVGSKTLSDGENTIAVVVTAEDGTKKTYTIKVTKEADTTEPEPAKSDDATLKSLDVSGYTLSPKFSPNTTSYTMTVASTVSSLKVDAIASDDNATVTVTGNSGWTEGVNVVKIKVTAEDGTEKIYTVNVTKKGTTATTGGTTTTKSSDNYLKELSTTNGTLSPKFVKTTSNYNITVPYDVEKLDLKAIANNSKAKVTITGNSDLKVGNNVIEIEVTAEDGSSRSYTINVTKSAKTSNNKLTNIILDGGNTSLSPVFNPDVYEYNIEVDPKTNSIDLKAITGNSNAKVEVTGNNNLQEGNNVILVKVTDENGFTQYYQINAYKKASNGLGLLGTGFSTWLISGLLILIPVLLILLILAKKKKEEKEPQTAGATIEFKPEFNFSSKNGTDDDYVESGAVLNQNSGIPVDKIERFQEKQEKTQKIDIRDIPTSIGMSSNYDTGLNRSMMEEYPERELPKRNSEIPYDPYDNVVTKDEIIDALNDKDPEKLKVLYEQEMLNRKKEELRKRDEEEYEYARRNERYR